MSKYTKPETELRLMEVSQDITSEAYRSNQVSRPYTVSPQHIDEWNSSWDEIPDDGEFVEIEDIIDADMDGDILDLDEY